MITLKLTRYCEFTGRAIYSHLVSISSTMSSSKARGEGDGEGRFTLHNDIASEQDRNEATKAVLDAHRRLTSDRPSIDTYLQCQPGQNRYPAIACYDSTRFQYKNDPTKFFHANWVDGVRTPRAYLLATGPHDEDTCRDFWRMVIEARPYAIVLMNEVNNPTAFYKRFWPSKSCKYEFEKDGARWIKVQNEGVTSEAPDSAFTHFTFTVTDCKNDHVIKPAVFQMIDDDSPVPAYFPLLRSELLELAENIFTRKKGKTHLKRKVLLVCGDGITKNGNFAVFDIVMDRAATHERVGLKETARIVMDQRWGTVGSSDEYKLLHAMIKAQIQPLLQRARRSNASSQD
uniref:Protein tyrosine phosphatase n=2 Tax=Meloidogyne TaxID=189290 RepID=A0A914LSA2_MELIC